MCGGAAEGVADLKVKRQENDQFGVGQLAHLVAVGPWGAACPVRVPSGWLWLRPCLRGRRDLAWQMSGADDARPLFVGLARAKFGLGAVASGIIA